MKLEGGGFIIAAGNLEVSIEFYCKAMELELLASDGSSAMLEPKEQQAGSPWLLALRQVNGQPTRPGRSAAGLRAVFCRIEMADLNGLEQRLRELDGFHERHDGEFYKMVSAYDPDRTALGFWASLPGALVKGPTFVPPSIYFLD
jgi:hypothetical protein